jgi:hypothetical protein
MTRAIKEGRIINNNSTIVSPTRFLTKYMQPKYEKVEKIDIKRLISNGGE